MAQKRIFFLLGAEGLDGYAQNLATIDWLYEQGVRHVGLTWNAANDFAGGVHTDIGLTELGVTAVKRIQQKRMLLDVSHLNDKSLRNVLRVADGPVLASHSNSRRLCAVPRNLTDEQIKAIAATGGVVGINSHPPFIHVDMAKQDLAHLADHVVYLAELVGVNHVAFGFDLNYWDENHNAVALPEMRGYGQPQLFLEQLRRRGFAEQELMQIAQGNLLRLIRRALA